MLLEAIRGVDITSCVNEVHVDAKKAYALLTVAQPYNKETIRTIGLAGLVFCGFRGR